MNNAELLLKWGDLVRSADIPTWTEPVTLCYLAELASQSDKMIECGTYLGASAKVMLLANPSLQLYCIDLFEVKNEPMCIAYLDSIGVSKPGMTTGEICRWHTLKKEIDEGRCWLIKGDSEVGARKLPLIEFDAVWVDDGHATEDLKRDIRCLLPFVKHGGEMCGHDFDIPHNDVALGVLASLPNDKVSLPVPRMWSYTKP